MADNFTTKIPLMALDPLLELGNEFGFDPTSSLEAEEFFAALVAKFTGSEGSLARWLRDQVGHSFKCIHERPNWIQNPDWPITEHGPMTFVGQIDIAQGLFHDEASFYTFYEPRNGLTRTVVQVA